MVILKCRVVAVGAASCLVRLTAIGQKRTLYRQQLETPSKDQDSLSSIEAFYSMLGRLTKVPAADSEQPAK